MSSEPVSSERMSQELVSVASALELESAPSEMMVQASVPTAHASVATSGLASGQ